MNEGRPDDVVGLARGLIDALLQIKGICDASHNHEMALQLVRDITLQQLHEIALAASKGSGQE